MPGRAPAEGTTPLTPEQLRALVDTSRRAKKVRRGAAVARLGGWTGAVFAALTLVSLAFSFDLSTAFVGVGLAVVAAGEFHGAALLSRLDARGPRRLALNQALLAAVLIGYGAWKLMEGVPPLPATAASGDPEIDRMIGGMVGMVHTAIYGTLIGVGAIAPALTAWYYASRGRLLRELRESAEPSVLQALRAA